MIGREPRPASRAWRDSWSGFIFQMAARGGRPGRRGWRVALSFPRRLHGVRRSHGGAELMPTTVQWPEVAADQGIQVSSVLIPWGLTVEDVCQNCVTLSEPLPHNP